MFMKVQPHPLVFVLCGCFFDIITEWISGNRGIMTNKPMIFANFVIVSQSLLSLLLPLW